MFCLTPKRHRKCLIQSEQFGLIEPPLVSMMVSSVEGCVEQTQNQPRTTLWSSFKIKEMWSCGDINTVDGLNPIRSWTPALCPITDWTHQQDHQSPQINPGSVLSLCFSDSQLDTVTNMSSSIFLYTLSLITKTSWCLSWCPGRTDCSEFNKLC